jgi:hypothetical protein
MGLPLHMKRVKRERVGKSACDIAGVSLNKLIQMTTQQKGY